MCLEMMHKVQLIKKPVSVITSFSESTTKDLISIQSEYMLQQLNSVMLRCRALSQVENLEGTVEDCLEYFEGVSNELSDITGQEVRLLKFYKNKLIDLVDKNISEIPVMSVSYRMTEGEHISLVNVQKDNAQYERVAY